MWHVYCGVCRPFLGLFSRQSRQFHSLTLLYANLVNLLKTSLIDIVIASTSNACASFMDPLIILSVAGTVVQFTDFGLKVFAEGRQLYKSTRGVLTANEELELVTADLRALVMKVGRIHVSEAAESASDEDREAEVNFGKICCDATKLADELIEKLDKLKLKGDKRRIWESFRKAIESAWSKDQVKALSQRFEGLRKAVESHALFSIR